MSDIVKFFWNRFQRAKTMDMTNKLLGKPTHFWIESENWTDAYKHTLSNSKKQEFEKEWKKLDQQLEAWHNAEPKKQANMKNPLSW